MLLLVTIAPQNAILGRDTSWVDRRSFGPCSWSTGRQDLGVGALPPVDGDGRVKNAGRQKGNMESELAIARGEEGSTAGPPQS